MVFSDILGERRIGISRGRYIYKVTQKGTQSADTLESKLKQIFVKIKDLVGICDEYCRLDPHSLSFAAKVHYMLDAQKTRRKALSEEELADMGKSFGWKISKSNIKNGCELLDLDPLFGTTFCILFRMIPSLIYSHPPI